MRWFVMCLLIAFSLMASPAAEAEKYKRVSPTKYEKGKPFKGYVFAHARLYETTVTKGTDIGLRTVEYINEESRDRIYGVLDVSGKKPVWVAEPKYAYVSPVSAQVSLLSKLNKAGKCILNHKTKTCTDTDYERAIGWVDAGQSEIQKSLISGAAPAWTTEMMFARYVDPSRVDIGLFSPSGKLLGEIENVAQVVDVGGFHRIGRVQAIRYGEAALFRQLDEKGQPYDIAVLPTPTGLSVESVPAFSIFKTDFNMMLEDNQHAASLHYDYMFTADVEEGLYWPLYEDGLGFKLAPANLEGVKPLYWRQPNACDTDPHLTKGCPIASPETANVLCCNNPSGWLAKWLTEDGIRWALIRTNGLPPSFKDVLASRENAIYQDIRALADYDGRLQGLNEPNKETRKWLFVRADGATDVYGYEWDNSLNITGMAFYDRFAAGQYGVWIDAEREKQRLAAIRNEKSLAELRARLAAQAEASRLAQVAYEEKLEKMRIYEMERAERRRQNLRNSWAAYRKLERERAEERLQQEIADYEANKWTRIWTDFSIAAMTQPSQTVRPTPQIDFYKSYSSSNTSGRYVTSSGAIVGCAGALGSGASC